MAAKTRTIHKKGRILTYRGTKLIKNVPEPKKKGKAKPLSQNAKLDRSPLYDPTALIYGHNLKHAVDTIVGQEFAPQEAALKTQASQTKTQGNALIGRAQGYYKDIAGRQQQATAAQQAIAQRLQQSTADVGSETGNLVNQAGKDATDALDTSEKLTGVDTSARATLARELALGQINHAQTQQQVGATAAQQGYNYAGLAAAQQGASQLRGQETVAQLANRMASKQSEISAQQVALGQQKGSEWQKQFLNLRQSQFENRATLAGLDLKAADLRAQVANQKANRKLAKDKLKVASAKNKTSAQLAAARLAETRRHNKAMENARTDAERLAETRRHNKAMEKLGQERLNKGGKTGKPPKEPQASLTAKTHIENARSIIRQGIAHGSSSHAIRAYLAKHKFSPVVVNSAMDLEYRGFLSGPNRAALQRGGVNVSRYPSRPPSSFRPPSTSRR